MNIKGLNKAGVLAALYNAAKPQGMGFMHYDPKRWTIEDAQEELDRLQGILYFDYLKGRVMYINLAGDEIYTGEYNGDNGDGLAEKIIEHFRKTGNVSGGEIDAHHIDVTLESISHVQRRIDNPTTGPTVGVDGVASITLGYADVADLLAPRLGAAREVLSRRRNERRR